MKEGERRNEKEWRNEKRGRTKAWKGEKGGYRKDYLILGDIYKDYDPTGRIGVICSDLQLLAYYRRLSDIVI